MVFHGEWCVGNMPAVVPVFVPLGVVARSGDVACGAEAAASSEGQELLDPSVFVPWNQG